ncbi:MAG: hypothetical protein R3C68_15145 [Myxococcota bacterium]
MNREFRQSRVYAYNNHSLIDPGSALSVELQRFDRTDTLKYSKHDEFLLRSSA